MIKPIVVAELPEDPIEALAVIKRVLADLKLPPIKPDGPSLLQLFAQALTQVNDVRLKDHADNLGHQSCFTLYVAAASAKLQIDQWVDGFESGFSDRVAKGQLRPRAEIEKEHETRSPSAEPSAPTHGDADPIDFTALQREIEARGAVPIPEANQKSLLVLLSVTADEISLAEVHTHLGSEKPAICMNKLYSCAWGLKMMLEQWCAQAEIKHGQTTSH